MQRRSVREVSKKFQKYQGHHLKYEILDYDLKYVTFVNVDKESPPNCIV